MTPRSFVPVEFRELAVAQGGVVGRGQLLGLGLSAAAVDRAQRRWTRLAPGVYWLAPPVQEPRF